MWFNEFSILTWLAILFDWWSKAVSTVLVGGHYEEHLCENILDLN